jgi:hypothetical protein
MRARKDLERKKPTRRTTETYWTEGQFQSLIRSGPAKLASRSMIPYNVLIYLLHKYGTLHAVREFISKRFTTPETIAKYQNQLEHMINNLAKFEFLSRAEDANHVTLNAGIEGLLVFRSVDPLYGAFLCKQLSRGSFEEKVLALESILSLPPAMDRVLRPPVTLAPGPLQTEVLQPLLISMGIATAHSEGGLAKAPDEDAGEDYWEEDFEPRPMTLPDMLKALFEAQLASPENVLVIPRWAFGGIHEAGGDFFKFIRAHDQAKNEGLILRHLLRLVILAGEFRERSGGDPDYERLSQLATEICQQVDPRYTDRFLASEAEARELGLP